MMDVYETPETYPEQNCNEKGDALSLEELKGLKNVAEEGHELIENEIDGEEIDKEAEYNQQLRDRIIMLRATLYDLKKQLREEKESWKREIHHIAAVQHDPYSDNLRYSQNSSFNEINQMHLEKASLQRQLAITNYKRRLLEVENMCTMELMRVKQSVKFLQPLQVMISEWSFDNNRNDFPNQAGDSASLQKAESITDLDYKQESLKQKDGNLAPLELISNKLYNEMNDMFNVLSAHCQETIPNWQEDNGLQSRSTTAFSDCATVDQN